MPEMRRAFWNTRAGVCLLLQCLYQGQHCPVHLPYVPCRSVSKCIRQLRLAPASCSACMHVDSQRVAHGLVALALLSDKGESRLLSRAMQESLWPTPRVTCPAVIAAPALDAAPPLAAGVTPCLAHPPQHRIHIDYAHSITLGRNKEQYYLMIVIDSIDFTWAQSSPNRSEPEDLIHDFITLTGIKVGHVRADGAGEFARSSTFKAYCKRHNIVIEEVPAYTH